MKPPLIVLLPTFFLCIWGSIGGALYGFFYAENAALAEFARNGDDGGASEFVAGLIIGLPVGAIAGLFIGAIAGLFIGVLALFIMRISKYLLWLYLEKTS